MADEIRSEIRIDIDTNDAISSLKNLQRQISIFQRQMSTSTAANAAAAQNIQRNLINTINATGQFSANIKTIRTTTESFTTALEKNKLSMGEYFRYAGGASKTFGKLFKQEFDTIQKVAESRVRTLQTQYIKLGRDANGAVKAISVRPLALDMENLATKTQIAAQRQALLNQLLKQGSTNLLNFGKNTQWAGRQLMVGFTIPLGILGAQASRTFMELEQQAIKFRRVYGDTFTATEETEAMLKQIKELSSEFTKYGVAAQQTMGLAADAAASGKMGADLLAQVTEATRLSVLGNTEAAQALETTISVANAFGTAAEDLAGKIDFLNAVENQTVTSIEDLTIAIPKAGPVVKQLGGDVEDLAFFLTAMKEGGINASEGANALKSGLASLINPTGKAAEMLAGFGINIKQIVEANKGDVKGIVIDFANALNTLDPLNRARAIEQLFGKFQFSRLSTLFQNVVAQGTQASRVLELTQASAAELALLSERELKRLEDSPMFKFQKAVEDLKVALAPVGEAFLKAVTPVIEFGTQILKKFDELDQGTKNFIVSLVTLLGGIGPIAVMTFGLLANGIAQIIKGFTFVRGIFLKTGKTTETLGASTEYMTQQQLEAAAVAASLDQTHAKLAQTFNVERAAVDKLTAAYQRAIAAQERLNVKAVGTTIKPKKLAKGILSVPGPKGAGDIVPAMLSPGEAVIPADIAQKNRGFIAAMFANKIPGFEKGLFQETHLTSGMRKSPQVMAALEAKYPGFSSLPQEILDILVPLSDLTSTKTTALNQAARGSRGMGAEQFLEEWAKNPDGLRKAARRAEQAGEMLIDSANDALVDGLDAEIGKKTANKILDPRTRKDYAGWLDDLIAESTSEVLDEAMSSSNPKLRNVAQGLKARAGRVGTLRTQFGGDEDAKIRALLASGKAEIRGGTVYATGTDVQIGRPSYSKDKATREREKAELKRAIANGAPLPVKWRGTSASKGAFRNQPGGTYEGPERRTQAEDAERAGILVGKRFKKGQESVLKNEASDPAMVQRSRKRNSPHPQVAKDGADDGKAYGKARTKAQIAELKKLSKQELYEGKRRVTAQMKAERRQTELRAKREAAAVRQRAKEEQLILQQEQAKTAPPKTAAARGGKLRSIAGRYGGVAAGVGTAAVAGASMMGGQIGEIASNALLPLMLLQGTGLGAKMLGPAMLPIAGFAAVAASAYTVVDSFNKAKDKALEMGEVFSNNSSAMKDLAAVTGRVSASDVMSRQRQEAFSIFKTATNGEPGLPEMLAGSEGGQVFTDQLRTMITSGLDRVAIADKFAMQMANAVSSGILNGIEARALIDGITQKLGDQALGLAINGNLTKLIGSNGENLMNEPFKMRVQLIAANQQRLGDAAKELGDLDVGPSQEERLKRLGLTTAIGAAVGQLIPIPGVTAAIGAAIGMLAGQTWNLAESAADLGQATGAFAANVKLSLEGTQQNIDAMDLAYQTKLKELQAANDLEGVAALTAKYERERADALRLNAKNITTIEEAYKSKEGFLPFETIALDNSIEDALRNAYKGTDQEAIVGQVLGDINSSVLSGAQKYVLKSLAASGQLSLGQTDIFLEIFGGDQKLAQKGIDIAKKFGAAFTGQLIDVASILEEDKRQKFILDMQTRDPQNALETLKFFQQLAQMGGTAAEVQARIVYYSDPQNYAEYKKQMSEIDALAKAGKLDITSELQQKIGLDQVSFNQLKKNQEWFSKLKPEQKVTFMQNYITRISTITDEAARGQISRDAQASGIKSPDAIERMFGDPRKIAEAKAKIAVEESKLILDAMEAAGLTTNGGGGGGGGGSPAIDYLNKIKQETAAASREIKLLNKGYNPQFASFLANAEASVRKIYMTEKDGKVILTQKGKLLEEAYDNNVLKNFALNQKQLETNLKAQTQTLDTLIAAGVDYKIAREAATNADIQAAVAAALTIKNDKLRKKALDEIAKTLKIVNGLQSGADWKDQQAAVMSDIKSAQAQVAAYKRLTQAGMSGANAYEVIADSALAASIAQTATNAEIEAFINNYKLLQAYQQQARNPLDVIIEGSQKQIDVYQSEMTSFQDALSKLQIEENKINDQYDKRIEALDKVQEANREILAQQKAQLDVADAITRGDIAAAARAVREAKAEQTERAIDDQKDALREARDAQVEALTITVNGQTMTIKQLNDKILSLEGQILDERIKTLNPAQQAKAKQELDQFVSLDEAKNIIDTTPLSQMVPGMQTEPEPEPTNPTTQTPTGNGGNNNNRGGGNNGGNNGSGGTNKEYGFTGSYVDPNAPKATKELVDAANTLNLVAATNSKVGNVAVNASKALAAKAGVTVGATTADAAERKITTLVTKATQVVDKAKSGAAFKASGMNVAAYIKNPTPLVNKAVTTSSGAGTRVSGGGGGTLKYKAAGGFINKPLGSDTIPAMLTPGEFVVSKFGVEKIGLDNLKAINNGKFMGGSVYNYEVNVNVKSESNPDQIARAVLTQIKQIDAQRIRSNRI